jgi:hypothetical protein
MGASPELWKKLRAAQAAKNSDASVAYHEAIQCANKGNAESAAWWERQGDMAMPTEKKEQESLSVGPRR